MSSSVLSLSMSFNCNASGSNSGTGSFASERHQPVLRSHPSCRFLLYKLPDQRTRREFRPSRLRIGRFWGSLSSASNLVTAFCAWDHTNCAGGSVAKVWFLQRFVSVNNRYIRNIRGQFARPIRSNQRCRLSPRFHTATPRIESFGTRCQRLRRSSLSKCSRSAHYAMDY